MVSTVSVHPYIERLLTSRLDAFRDDDSDDEPSYKRGGGIPLRPIKPLPKGSFARMAHPRDPEPIPLRFFTRSGPAVVEPYKSILSEATLLKRTAERACRWKGCDSIMASEALLQEHVAFRDHLSHGAFQEAGVSIWVARESRKTDILAQHYGETILWRCHWRGCEGPCFSSKRDLWQHTSARHISRTLSCPYPDCDLSSPTVSHLSRHVMKQHDDDPSHPIPMANLSEHLPPPYPVPLDQPLPEIARTDELILPVVPGSSYVTQFRRDWARDRVANNCFAGPDPVMHVEHPPHILEKVEETPEPGEISDDEEETEDEEIFDADEVVAQRLLDRASGVVRRITPVVLLKRRRRPPSYIKEPEVILIDDADVVGGGENPMAREDTDKAKTQEEALAALASAGFVLPAEEDQENLEAEDEDDDAAAAALLREINAVLMEPEEPAVSS